MRADRRLPQSGSRSRTVPLAALSLLSLVIACEEPEPALVRGDRMWADSNYAGALAEYRLALRQHGESEAALARAAHAYAVTGELPQARELYDRLIRQAPEHVDQALFDYATLARRAQAKGDTYGMAGAVEAAVALRPEMRFPDLANALAQHYAEAGDAGRARLYLERAAQAGGQADSAANALFQLATIHEGEGRCGEAIRYFQAYRRRAPTGERAEEARWHAGSCAFQLAKAASAEGRSADALAHLATVLELGAPPNLQDEAWFERGELLLAAGDTPGALEAYGRVLELSGGRRSPLVERAEQRMFYLRGGR